MAKSGFTRVARIVGTFGLRGFVKVEPLTEFMERFEPGETLYLLENPVEIEEASWHGDQVRLKLSGIDKIEQAEPLRWEYLSVPASRKPKLEKDEYFSSDLVGLMVSTDDGRVLGPVDEVIMAPAHDLIRVGETLIPAVKVFVLKVDMKARTMLVHLIPGMGPDEEPEEVR